VLFSFWEAGCPHTDKDVARVVADVQKRGLSPIHHRLADNLCAEGLAFCRASGLESSLSSRGLDLMAQLEHLKLAYDSHEIPKLAESVNSAIPLRADRLSLPEVAGQCNVADWLIEPYRSAFLKMPETVPIEPMGPALQPCLSFEPGEDVKIAERLLDAEAGVLLPECELIRDSNGKIVGGGDVWGCA